MGVDHRRLINEAPTVVGLMTSILESGGSLDVASRTVASEGPPISRAIFEEAVRNVDTKSSSGMKDALIEGLGGLSNQASGYRQAMMLCISASDAIDATERLRILREASDVSLDAVRIMGEKYSASLTTPCMIVFGLGIMAPMILMSILPMLSIGGMFGTMPIDRDIVVTITCVLIPAFILLLAYRIRRDNPFLIPDNRQEGLIGVASISTSVPLFIMMRLMERSPEEAMLLSVSPACIVCMMLLFEGRRRDSKRSMAELGLKDSIFEIGNSLLGGDNFEKVVIDVIASRPECSEVGLMLERELDLCRGDVPFAVRSAISPTSLEVSRTLCDIHACSEKDTDDAGRLAIAMGRQFQNGNNIRKELELRLKSMTDMMIGTAMIFAPMVLGMSMSMLGPLSEISGYQGMDGTGGMLSFYLIELSAMISILISSLGGGEGLRGIVWRFCLMTPVALLVFRICMGFQL